MKRILVIDVYDYPRDMAQMDIYDALKYKYDVILSNIKDIKFHMLEDKYDYLYLGLLHSWMNLDWNNLLKLNKKPYLIDQADNEGFVSRNMSKINYVGDFILLSRYLPNENLNKSWKHKIELLPWYIDPDRFEPKTKTIDISYVCNMSSNRIGINRIELGKKIIKYCIDNNLSYVVGEHYGEKYKNIIERSKAFVIDGSRYCLTQKYIEASLSGCLLIGEKPLYPDNELITLELNKIKSNNIDNYNDIILHNKRYVLNSFANKKYFLKIFDNILTKF